MSKIKVHLAQRWILFLQSSAKREKCDHKDYFCQIKIIWCTRIASWILVGWIYFTRIASGSFRRQFQFIGTGVGNSLFDRLFSWKLSTIFITCIHCTHWLYFEEMMFAWIYMISFCSYFIFYYLLATQISIPDFNKIK